MARTKKSGEASTSTAVKLKESDSIVSDKQSETLQPQDIQTTETVRQKQNKFASFQEFKTFVKQKFIEGSGIAPELFAECIEFHTDSEVSAGNDAEYPIHELLNWKQPTIYGHQARETIYAAMFKNEDGSIWQGIISIWDEESKKPYQYRAPTKNGDRVFLPPVPNSIRRKIGSRYGVEVPEEGSFWEWLKTANQVETSPLGGEGNFTAYSARLVPLKVPRIVTEGGKKGLALLTQGYIPLSLYGCTCGGRKELIPDLREFNQEGSMWLFALDRDSKEKTKRTVNAAKRDLGKVLAKDGFKIYIEDIVWSSEDGKGVDDLIVNKGFGAFDTVYSRALGRLEKQFSASASGTADEPEKHKNAPPDQMAKKIAEDYRGKLAFNDETKQWMRYGDDLTRSLEDLPFGIWSPESNEYMEAIVYKILSAAGAFAFGADYVSSVVKLLRHELIERRWNEVSPREYLPFTNGVVEIATGKLLPHTPGYKLTWSLPREYSTGGSWDNISNFLEHLSNGNADIKELLICYCNAVIKGRYDLQKFIHLIGLGGTGKGTFTRLVTELIGDQNVLVTNLPAWCMNQFEGANAFGKRLVIFPDEDPYRGSIGRFLSLTGEDKVRAEEKGKRAFNFDYQGMTLVCSNFPVFSGGSSSRAKRRTITVPCNKIVPERQRKQLSKVFEPELAAFTNYLLSLSDDHVTAVLKGEKEIPQCTLEFWENQMKGDSVAAWVNDKVIYDPMATTQIGNDRNEGSNGAEVYTLFGSYVRHCLASGDSPKSHKVFSPDLIELCHTILGWPVVKKATETGKFIKGLRLRHSGIDDHMPTYDYYLMQRVRQADGSPDGSPDGSKSLSANDNDGSDGLSTTLLGEEVDKTELANNSVQNQPSAADESGDRTPKPSDCWYTPDTIVQLVTDVLSTIDLDPCSDDGKHIKASQHFTFADDGLSKDWSGRVFMNPPYSKPSAWIDKLQQEIASGRVTEAIALVPASTDTNWLHPLLQTQLVCFWKGRIKFLDVNYQPQQGARQSHCFIYWGNRPERFREVFAAYGAFNKEDTKPSESTPTTMQDCGQGDKVKIINQNCQHFGQEDEITAIYSLAEEVKLKVAGRVPPSWIEILEKHQSQPATATSANTGDYIKIINHPTRTDVIGTVEKVARIDANGMFITESGVHLMAGEFEPVDKSEVSVSKPTVEEATGLIIFEEKGLYLHKASGKQTRIQKLYKSVNKADVIFAYPDLTSAKIDLSELAALPESPRSPLAVGDKVLVGTTLQGTIELLEGNEGAWVRQLPIGKSKTLGRLSGPYFAHLIRKV